ncbi:hypothetical protein SynA1825c_02781 [Synechococcus sp. A18-25c]|nr:hypothetical protein SynA1560_02813 [Synechococcus sp. A15-60]QNJ21057.1 hypothetical protein SynA1825c_02781 [Synechococcus sp. A18-25c]
MAISDESDLLEGGTEARRWDDPSQAIHSRPTGRRIGLYPPMMQTLQPMAG